MLPLRRGLGSLQILVPSSRSSQVDREPLPSDRELFSEGFSATESGPRLEPFLRPDEAETVAPEAISMESLTGCGWRLESSSPFSLEGHRSPPTLCRKLRQV